MDTSEKNEREVMRERRRLGAFLASLTIDEIKGIKQILVASLVEHDRKIQKEQKSGFMSIKEVREFESKPQE